MGVILTNVFVQFPIYSKRISQRCEIKREQSTFTTKKRMQLASCFSSVCEVELNHINLKMYFASVRMRQGDIAVKMNPIRARAKLHYVVTAKCVSNTKLLTEKLISR